MLERWCTCVMRSKVDPMKDVARMIRSHLQGIVAWAQTRQTNGFLEAINGLFQAAKRRARGFTRIATIRTVIFLIAVVSTSRPSTLMLRNPLEIHQSPYLLPLHQHLDQQRNRSRETQTTHGSEPDDSPLHLLQTSLNRSSEPFDLL